MKSKNFLLAMALGFSFASNAQWPTTLLNTATNGAGSTTSYGTLDAWKTSTTSITSGFSQAVHVLGPTGASGWATPPTNAGWITYKHGCSTTDDQSWCPSGANIDEYYKITITLTNPGTYVLNYSALADNCIYKMYLNNTSTAFYTTPSTIPYTYSGFTSTSTVVGSITGWQPGVNTLYVHVKSGNGSSSGNTGFLFYATGTYSTGNWPANPYASCCLGNSCGSQQNGLNSNYEVPLNSFDFNFSGDEQSDKVNVGYNCGTSGLGKLNAFTSIQSNYSGTGPQSSAIHGKNLFSNGISTGVFGEAQNSQDKNMSVGVWGTSTGGADARGVFGQGVNGINSYGGYFEALSGVQGANYGVYATAANGNGNNWAGWFQGDVTISGNGWVNGAIPISSDRRFKTNIKELTNVTEKIKNLKGYTYDFKTDEFKTRNFPKTQQIGFIAQELKEIFPQLVLENKDGYYGVNYMGFIPVLLQAAKEQQAVIDNQSESIQQQQKQIDELKTLVQSMVGINTTTGKTTGVPVNLSDKNAVVLNQNVPNPFAESTVITYNVPSDFSKAQIIFTTNEGKIIKTIDITVKGSGSLNVFANDLSHGMYSYSLVIDGKTIDTKKMIKE